MSILIQGKEALALIQSLKTDKIFLNMTLLGTDSIWTTILINIKKKGITKFILLDCPNGFEKCISGLDQWQLLIEFYDKNKIPYEFKTLGEKISGKELWLRLPKKISRLQRRKNFRLDSPLESFLILNLDTGQYKLNVYNISEGGSLITVAQDVEDSSIFSIGQKLSDLIMEIPFKSQHWKIFIKEAKVRRLEKPKGDGPCRYGIEFIKLEPGMKEVLKKLIYGVQRQMLKRRVRIDS